MITVHELSEFYEADRIKLSKIVSKLRKEWCPFAQKVGRCDFMCSANPFCVEHITEILAIKGEPRDEYAVLMYRIRNERAKISETREQPTLDVNRFGEIKNDWQTILRRADGPSTVRPANSVSAETR